MSYTNGNRNGNGHAPKPKNFLGIERSGTGKAHLIAAETLDRVFENIGVLSDCGKKTN
ncbi:MAG: hypothetical protein KA746_13070 [Pyrinomonadaceae bacterium]|nr:hypothetical protein [Pyrinomonadaceae bacterium]MBP6213863.1 hypothetical protein [Pyrinomonadaceae bacterium]